MNGKHHHSTQPDPGNVNRILLVKPDNLGDVILFTGALKQIRQHYSNARISLCAKKVIHPILNRLPYIDDLIPWEPVLKLLPDWVPDFPGKSKINALVRKVRMTYFHKKHPSDLYLLPVRSTVPLLHQFTAVSRARWKYGISGDTNHITTEQDASYSSIYTKRFRVDESDGIMHEFETTRGFLSQLGIHCSVEDLWPDIRTNEEEAMWANEMIQAKPDAITLAIAPGVTSIPEKYYAADNYRIALSKLENHRIDVVIFGSNGEIEQCKAVQRSLKTCANVRSVINFAGRTTLGQLAEGLKRCDILVSNETGVLHLATALRMPTVGILGGGHFKRFYPWGDPTINLFAHKPMDCYFCNWYCIHDSIRCIHEIEPEKITEQILKLIQNKEN